MHPADIQAKLKKKGITQKDIAEELGVSTLHISEVVNKKRVSDRVMKTIAARIGRDPVKVFPEYYLSKKKRKHGHQVVGSEVPGPRSKVQGQDSRR